MSASMSIGMAALIVLSIAAAAVRAAEAPRLWAFRVLLDGRPIGEHRFALSAAASAAERTLSSEAEFTVRWLGLVVYRYRHRAVERWRGDCLAALSADTDDGGQRSSVAAVQEDAEFRVVSPATQLASGCVMSFAYWNPAIRGQGRLLNAQTGRIEAVTITPLQSRPSEPGLRDLAVQGLRITGLQQPITVWYTQEWDWVGLDTVVEGGRQLSYRRQ